MLDSNDIEISEGMEWWETKPPDSISAFAPRVQVQQHKKDSVGNEEAKFQSTESKEY